MITVDFTKQVLDYSGFHFSDVIIESITMAFNQFQGDPDRFIGALNFVYGFDGYSKDTFAKVYQTLDDVLSFHFSI